MTFENVRPLTKGSLSTLDEQNFFGGEAVLLDIVVCTNFESLEFFWCFRSKSGTSCRTSNIFRNPDSSTSLYRCRLRKGDR